MRLPRPVRSRSWPAACAAGLAAAVTAALLSPAAATGPGRDRDGDGDDVPGGVEQEVEQEKAARAGCATDADHPKRQLRADWIASVSNIDWPSAPGLPASEQRAELVGYLDEAVDRGLNAVVLQVRPTADTFWPSDLEPWSAWLTGEAGKGPGYDPLRFAVREAHSRGLELHAWFNPYRVSQTTDRSALDPESPAAQNPDWVVEYGGKLYYDPGLPQVRQLTTDVIMEAVRRYDIDGVHFDDYFYPYPVGTTPFPDDATFATYGAGFPDTPEGRADWRRDNVNRLVEGLNERIHRAKPWVLFGVSPFAVWRNQATDPEGSATTAGAETYDDLYADTRRWVREEWIDYVAPQVYWNIGFAAADYGVLVPWWSQQVKSTDVQLYIGQATYKVGVEPVQDPAWRDPEEMTDHLFFNRDFPQVDGDIYFSAKQVRANRLGHMDLVQFDHYQRPALLPVTAGVPGKAPKAVKRLDAERRGQQVRLTWRGSGGAGERYAVYRVPGRGVGACDLADATHLLGTTEGPSWRGPAGGTGPATYVVTALDRAHRESKAVSTLVRGR
jgi:uncharacterized lipoprotein YddW (UPF0748 family)